MRSETMAIACDPEAVPGDQRDSHAILARDLFAERQRVPVQSGAASEGYRFDFDAELFDDLARWIANERRCCPFLRFTMDLSPAGGMISVAITGPEGTRVFIDAEIPGIRTEES